MIVVIFYTRIPRSFCNRRHRLLRDESFEHVVVLGQSSTYVNEFSLQCANFYCAIARYSLHVPFCAAKIRNGGTCPGVLSSMRHSGNAGTAWLKIAAEFCATRSESYAKTHSALWFSRIWRAFCQSSERKNCALSSMPSRLSCELPAIPGCPDQYAIDGESHHGARNGRISDDRKLSAMSRNCTDSLRCSTRKASSASVGQSLSSPSRKIGKIDRKNAIQTALRDLIGSSKEGSANAKTRAKKYPQRACQIVRT